jgi:hypothetical protein
MLLGEDAKSIAKHIALMKTEMRKKEPDRTVLRDAMKRTASRRQKYCHEHTTTEVLDEFPVLKMTIFVSTLQYLLEIMKVEASEVEIFCLYTKRTSGFDCPALAYKIILLILISCLTLFEQMKMLMTICHFHCTVY